MRKVCVAVCLVGFFLGTGAWGQPGSLQLGMLLDTPSAKTVPMGGVVVELRMYTEGGLLGSLSVGLTDRFCLGVSYGGENVVGTGKANLNPQPGVHLRYAILGERYLSPALVLGFDSQGYGGYDKTLERYAVKSRGVFAVVSKNTSLLGGIGLHGGVNYSLETKDGDSDPNFFAGCHKRLGQELVVLVEYDTAINDNDDNAVGSGKGYLNAGVRWSFAQRLFVEFSWKNILENRENVPGSSREVKMVYVTHF